MRMASRLVVALVLMTGAGAAYTAPASSAVPSWSVVPSANPLGAPTGFLSSVACVAATSCFAVGDYASNFSGVPLIDHWDGTSWSIMPVPAPDTSGGANLSDVACPGPTLCFAVGTASSSGVSSALIERWDGAAWSIAPTPVSPPVLGLVSVACASVTRCFAVSQSSALVEEWDGTTWSVVTTPSLPAGSALLGVSCGSTTCFAVGALYTGADNKMLIEQWNGTAWSIATAPLPAGTSSSILQTVSCASETSCLAVGGYSNAKGGGYLVEQWNGTSWSLVAGPKFATGAFAEILDLSCSSATDCFAVGDIKLASSKSYLSLTAHWNGVSWTTVPSPNANPKSDFLYGVSCSASASCFAVGFTGGGLSTDATVERWNGTSWSVMSIPQQTPANGLLSAVSCPTVSTCFGVGSYTSATGATATLVERSSPTGWSVVPSPNPAGATRTTLSGVSCPSATVCFAAGSWSGKAAAKTLIERWDGKAWSIMSSPGDPHFITSLTGIACTSAKNCFVVGQRQAEVLETLIERWNGVKWSIVPSPSRTPSPIFTTAGINNLQSVACASAMSCFAVGDDRGYLDDSSETLVLGWNGSKWSIVKSPNGAGAKFSTLSGVSCSSAKSCYAVGNSFAKVGETAPLHSLIEHWNGSVWTRVTSADPSSATRSSLAGVSCPTVASCFAVGDDALGAGPKTTLVKSLTGTTWSVVTSPKPVGVTDASLSGVSCRSATTCFAVGYSDHSAAPSTLVETYS